MILNKFYSYIINCEHVLNRIHKKRLNFQCPNSINSEDLRTVSEFAIIDADIMKKRTNSQFVSCFKICVHCIRCTRVHDYLSLCGMRLFSFGCSSSVTVASIISWRVVCKPTQSLQFRFKKKKPIEIPSFSLNSITNRHIFRLLTFLPVWRTFPHNILISAPCRLFAMWWRLHFHK